MGARHSRIARDKTKTQMLQGGDDVSTRKLAAAIAASIDGSGDFVHSIGVRSEAIE